MGSKAFQLVIAEGKEAGREFVFDQGSVVIGRTPECDVILYEAGVSRRHARIFEEGEGFSVEDLGSANGTIVNGEKVAKQPLRDGDAITMGPVRFTFSAVAGEGAAGAGEAPPPDGGQHTRVVNAAELKRSRNKGVVALPKGVDTGERQQIERRPTAMMRVLEGPRPSGSRPRVSRPGTAALVRSGPVALASADDTNPGLARVEVGGAANEQRLSAAERARLRRQGAGGAAALYWREASRAKRLALAGAAGVFLLLVLGLLLQAALPKETKRKAPEVGELNDQPVEQVFGVGPGVEYERVDQKVFEFELKSPVEVMVVLHYQCKELSEGELGISVNGVDMGFAPADTLAANEIDHDLLIPARHLKRNATNTIVFDNTKNPPEADPWSLWNVWVEVTVLPEKDEEGLKADATERYRRAEGKWEQRDIGASNRWEAYRGFREAWLFYEALPPEHRGPMYQLAHDRMMESRRELDLQCNKLLMQARAEFQQRKYQAASATLDWVEKFFPSRAHPCQSRAIDERDELAASLE